MNAGEIMDRLKARGFSVRLVDGAVKVAGLGKPDAETQSLLSELRERKAEVMVMLSENDPVVPVEAWYPVFSAYFRQVVEQIKDLDLGWVREYRPDLYAQIKAKEDQIDALGPAPLSKVMETITEWRRLLLEAHFQQRKHEHEQGKINTDQM